MSSRGQVVIPENVRQLLHLQPGTTFVVVAKGDAIVLHRVKEPSWDQFSDITAQAQKQAFHLGGAISAFRRAAKMMRS